MLAHWKEKRSRERKGERKWEREREGEREEIEKWDRECVGGCMCARVSVCV